MFIIHVSWTVCLKQQKHTHLGSGSKISNIKVLVGSAAGKDSLSDLYKAPSY